MNKEAWTVTVAGNGGAAGVVVQSCPAQRIAGVLTKIDRESLP